MNVLDLLESARPDVSPMPLDQRRMVRERLFGAADDVVRTTIRERSASGAVTATAPQGYRANRVGVRPKQLRSSGSFAKMGAGLLVVGAAGAAGWSWYADSNDDDPVSLTTTTIETTTTTTTTTPPTTTLTPTRTGVTDDEPVLFPLDLIPVEEAVVDKARVDGGFVVMRGDDGIWVQLSVIDGEQGGGSSFDFIPLGSLRVAPVTFEEGGAWIYTIETTCGAVRVIDAPGQEQFRPLMTDLFEGMSIDGGGSVDALLPKGLRVFESAIGLPEYRTVFRIEATGGDGDSGGDRLITLRQVPGGSVAQLLPGGSQPVEMVWLGEAALGEGDLDISDDQVDPVAIYWRDASSVFAVSSDTVPFDQLETFVSGLRAATTNSWIERFSAGAIDSGAPLEDRAANSNDNDGADPDDVTTVAPPCAPQPSLGPTFLP